MFRTFGTTIHVVQSETHRQTTYVSPLLFGIEEPTFGRLLHAKFHPSSLVIEVWGPKSANITEFRNINAVYGRIHCIIFTRLSAFVGVCLSSSVGY